MTNGGKAKRLISPRTNGSTRNTIPARASFAANAISRPDAVKMTVYTSKTQALFAKTAVNFSPPANRRTKTMDADKLDELERLLAGLRAIVASYEKKNPLRTADFHGEGCGCYRCAVDGCSAAINALPELVARARRVAELEGALRPFVHAHDLHIRDDDAETMKPAIVQTGYFRLAAEVLKGPTT